MVVDAHLQQMPGEFLNYTFDDNWRNLDFVEFRSNGLIDNINVAVAPEPVSSALFLAGAATLGLFRRLRQKTSYK